MADQEDKPKTIPLFHKETGTFIDVNDADVPAALQSGKFSFDPAVKRIPLTAPDGSTGTLPAEQAGEAFKQGFRFSTAEERSAGLEQSVEAMKQRRYGEGAAPVVTAIENVASAASFGLSDVATAALEKAGVTALQGASSEALERAKRNPEAAIAGQVVGSLIAPTGGLVKAAGGALVAKAGTQIAKAAIGREAVDLALRAANTKLAQGIVNSVAGKAGSAALGSAVEGAMFSGQQLITEAALGDPQLNAEHAASLLFNGAVYGGVAGGLLKGAGLMAQPAKELADRLIGKTLLTARKLAAPSVERIRKAFGKSSGDAIEDLLGRPVGELDDVIKLEQTATAFDKQVTRTIKKVTKENAGAINELLDWFNKRVFEAEDAVASKLSLLKTQPSQGQIIAAADDVLTKLRADAAQHAGTPAGDALVMGLAEMPEAVAKKSGVAAKTTPSPAADIMLGATTPKPAMSTGFLQSSAATLGDEMNVAWRARQELWNLSRKADARTRPLVLEAYDQLNKRVFQNPDLPEAASNVIRKRDVLFHTLYSLQRKIPDLMTRNKKQLNYYGYPTLKLRQNAGEASERLQSALSTVAKMSEDEIALISKVKDAGGFQDEMLATVSEILEQTKAAQSGLAAAPAAAGTLDEQIKALRAQGHDVAPIMDKVVESQKAIENVREVAKASELYQPSLIDRGVAALGAVSKQTLPVGAAFLSPKAVVSALGGAAVAQTAGMLTGSPIARLAQIGRTEKLLLTAGKSFTSATEKLANALTSEPVRRAVASQGRNLAPMKEQRKTFQKDAEEIRSWQDPAKASEAESHVREMFGEGAPQITDGIIRKMQQTNSFLISKLPTDPTAATNLFAGQSDYTPPDAEIAKFNRYVQAVKDPYSVIEDFARGVVYPEGIETLKTIYPQIYQSLQSTIMQDTITKEKRFTWKQKLILSQIFDVPADPTMTPEFIASQQAIYTPTNNGEQGGRPSNVSSDTLTASTETQQLIHRKES